MRLNFSVTWSEEDKAYVGLCKQFIYLSTVADTYEEALESIKQLALEVAEEGQCDE